MALTLGLAMCLLLLAAGLRAVPEVEDAEADALLSTLQQASALCSSTPRIPQRQARPDDATNAIGQ